MVSKMTNLERRVVDLEAQNLELKMHNESLVERNQTLIDEFEIDRMYLEAKIEDQCFETNRIAELHLETIFDLEEAQKAFNALDEELEKYQDKVSELEQEYCELTVRYSTVTNENSFMRSQIARHESLSDEWISYKEESEKIVRESSDALNNQRIMYHELSEQYNELTEQYAAVSEREKFITHRNVQTETQLGLVENELEVRDAQLEILKDSAERLKRRETDLEHEITELTRMFGDIAKGRVSR